MLELAGARHTCAARTRLDTDWQADTELAWPACLPGAAAVSASLHSVLSCYILHQHPLLADMTILVCMLHRDPNYLSLTNTNKTKRSKDATK